MGEEKPSAAEEAATDVGKAVTTTAWGDEPRWTQAERDRYRYERWRRNQINMPLGTDPRLSNQYYDMMTGPMNRKQAYAAGTVGLLGAGIERFIRSKEADTLGAKYAAEELAQARADMKASTPKVSEEEKYAIRTESMAPVKAAIEESKSDVESLVASKGGTVRDLATARDIGVGALAQAGMEGEALIAQKELENWQKGEAKKQAAEARADNMAAVVDKKQMEQLKYTADLIGDVAKVTLTTMAHKAAADDRSAVDQLFDKGVSLDDIKKLQTAAREAGWEKGSRGEHHHMLSHYKGGAGKRGGKGGKGGLFKGKADAPPTSTDIKSEPKIFPRPVTGPEDALARLKAASIEEGEPEARLPRAKINRLGKRLANVVTRVTSQSPGRHYPKNVTPGIKLSHSNMDDLRSWVEQHGYNPGGFDYYAHPQGRDSKGNFVTAYYAVSKGDPKPTEASTKVGSTIPGPPE